MGASMKASSVHTALGVESPTLRRARNAYPATPINYSGIEMSKYIKNNGLLGDLDKMDEPIFTFDGILDWIMNALAFTGAVSLIIAACLAWGYYVG